jgi:ELWxxDGT repeat protein
LYLSADDDVHGRELWKSDGTSDGTILLKDINQDNGQQDWPSGGSWPSQFAGGGDVVLFAALDHDNGDRTELWRSDGSEAGTVLVHRFERRSDLHINLPALIGEWIYFGGGRNAHELWRTDGEIVERVEVMGSRRSVALAAFDSDLLFSGRARDGRDYLYRTDGTSGGTVRLTTR